MLEAAEQAGAVLLVIGKADRRRLVGRGSRTGDEKNGTGIDTHLLWRRKRKDISGNWTCSPCCRKVDLRFLFTRFLKK